MICKGNKSYIAVLLSVLIFVAHFCSHFLSGRRITKANDKYFSWIIMLVKSMLELFEFTVV